MGWPALTYPNLPTSLSGAYVIGGVDQECQARVVSRLDRPYGVWIDDTTPNLSHWLGLALAKYTPLNQRVLVCVPPGRPEHHYPAPVISVYEAYFYGMGCPFEDWLPLPRFDAYVVQRDYPGTHGKHAPTIEQYAHLLGMVRAEQPSHIFLY